MAWEEVRRAAQLGARKTAIYRATVSYTTINNNNDVVLFEAKSPYGGKIRYLSINYTASSDGNATFKLMADGENIGSSTLITTTAGYVDMAIFGGTTSTMFSTLFKAVASTNHSATGATNLWANVTTNAQVIPFDYERKVDWEFLESFQLVKYGNSSALASGNVYIAIVYDIGRSV